jgi:4-hydroxybenzoate polyprenyltransferase
MDVLTQPPVFWIIGVIVVSGLLIYASYVVANRRRQRKGRPPLDQRQQVRILRGAALYFVVVVFMAVALGVWTATR